MKTDVKYFVYDERYRAAPDSAICYEVCDTLKEARGSGPDYGGFVIVREVSRKISKWKWEIIKSEIVN